MPRFNGTPLEKERKPRFGGRPLLPEHAGPGKSAAAERTSFRLSVPQEITLPSGETKTIDVLSPEMKRAALETGLSIFGGMIPGAQEARLLPTIARMAGSGIGAAGGSLLSESFDPSANPIRRAAGAGIAGAVGEGAGTLVTKGAGKLFGPSATIREGVPEAQKILKARGATLTPGQATESFGMDIAENIAEAGLFGGGAVRATKRKAASVAMDAVQEFADQYNKGATREQVGELLGNALQDGADAFRVQGRAMYKQVDSLSGQPIDITAFKAKARDILFKQRQGLRSDALDGLAEDILSRPDQVPWEEAAAMRSDLGAFSARGTETVKGKSQAAGGQLARALTDTMEQQAKQLDPAALKAWQQANDFWRQGKQTYNSRLVKNILRQEDPEVIARVINKGGRGSAATIKRIRGLVSNDDTWKAVQGEFLGDWISRGVTTEGNITGKALQARLKSFGEDALRATFSPEEVGRMRTLARTLELAQSKSGENALRFMVPTTQAGVAVGFGVAGSPYTGAAIMLGPTALAWVWRTPAAFKLLVEGIKAPAGSAVGTRAATKLMTLLARENLLKMTGLEELTRQGVEGQ